MMGIDLSHGQYGSPARRYRLQRRCQNRPVATLAGADLNVGNTVTPNSQFPAQANPLAQDGAVVMLNAGSSSLKFEVFDLGPGGLQCFLRGQIDGIGHQAHFRAKDGAGLALHDASFSGDAITTQHAALVWLLAWLRAHMVGKPVVAVGHRVVHGGTQFLQPVRVDAGVLRQLEALVPLAPLHQPHNLAPIRSLLAERPELPQVACFDTAFHQSQPPEAQMFALPWRFHEDGVRRYGFHGLSYEYIARTARNQVPALAAGRTVVAHLGNGVSLCALLDGRSLATTMGFTALDGCPMGTRCGSLDAGVVIHLARAYGMSMDAIESMLYLESGLLGLSGVSSDMQELLDSSAPGARRAVDYFVYQLAREVASMAAAIGGMDALVFTAGIGENSAPIRLAVCARLAWMGVHLDAQANAAGAARISSASSPVSVWRIATNEERMMAEHTCEVLGLRQA